MEAEQDKKTEKEVNEIDEKLAIDDTNVDWFLQSLVNMANNRGIEMAITLNIAGGLVSGQLIGGKKYFEEFAEAFSQAWPGEGKELIRASFAKTGEQVYGNDAQQVPTKNKPQFIHLKNAQVWNPGGGKSPSEGGVLWRGCINSISGFSLGKLINI